MYNSIAFQNSFDIAPLLSELHTKKKKKRKDTINFGLFLLHDLSRQTY